MSVGVQREPQIAIPLSVGWIHAESRARLGQRGIGVFCPVERIGKLTVRFREAGRQSGRFHEFIERFLESILSAQDGSQHKMQQSNIRRAYRGVWAKQSAELVFGAFEILSVNQNCNLGRRTRASASGVGWFSAGISI